MNIETKKAIADKINKITGWGDNPASVFNIAIPLFVIGMALMGSIAYLQYKHNGDIVYALILAGGLVLLAIGLYPPYLMHKRLKKMSESDYKK